MRPRSDLIRLDPSERLHGIANPIFGLTGGIATGKSSVSNMLAAQGLHVICADKLVKKIYLTPLALEFVHDHFPTVIDGNGINFKLLRDQAFSDDAKKEELERFIYTHLKAEFLKALPSDPQELVIYDVPLLFEKKLNPNVDSTICVYCPEELQRQRLILRDQIDDALAQKMLLSQWPIEEKKALANFVIDNSKDPEHLVQAVAALIKEIIDPQGY